MVLPKLKKIIKDIFYSLIWLLCWLLINCLYRIKSINNQNIPKKTGALIICNHVSYIDPLIISCSLKRPVRFFVQRDIYNNLFLNLFCRLLKAIPVCVKDKPKVIRKALETARTAVKSGELVCFFAEGSFTRTGNMLSFNKSFEFIMEDLNEPVIPMHIDKIWGSLFGFREGRFYWKLPKILPYPIIVYFGEPLPAGTKTDQVRAAIQEISAEAFKLRGKDQKKLHIAFIDETKKHPRKFCMADSSGLKLNYLQVLAMVVLFSKKIRQITVKPFDENEMVGILLPASCICAIINGAIMFAGKIPVNLNFTASKECLKSSVEQCRMNTIITSKQFIEKLGMESDRKMVFVEDILAGIKKFEKIIHIMLMLLMPAFLIKITYVKGDKIDVNDIATLIFSSGSTGCPKGVMLTHGNIFSNIEGLYLILNLIPGDIIMGVLPFFHSFGFTASLCFPLGAGIGVVYHTNPLDALTIGKLVKKHKTSIILGTPTFFGAYVKKCTAEQFKSIRYAMVGAEKMKRSISEAFFKKFGIIPFEGYGATELSPIVSLGIPDYINEKEGIKQVGFKQGTVGHPIPGIAVKIVDPETFAPLSCNKPGLLLVKGPNVMKGYLRQPLETKKVIKNGWYITGDIASIDEDGFICISDRLSRFSKIGGEMIPHIRIEEEIMDIMRVPEPFCAVTAVADEKKGEKLIVLCKKEVNIDKLYKLLSEKEIPRLWLPKKENFYAVDEIPILGSGKLDLKQIKKIAEDITAVNNI